MKPGIGLIAPAGYIEKEEIHTGIRILEKEGFRIKMGRHLYGKYRYFSGKISQRIEDIHEFLDDPKVQILYAVRGGSGSSQLLPYLDYQKWKKSGKILVGFSDITALQWALWFRAGIQSYSGMALTFQMNKGNPFRKLFIKQIQNRRHSITASDLKRENLIIARGGTAAGILLGGTLSIIVSLLGTPFFPRNRKPIILFIEDVNEPVYRVERSIVQLKLSGVLKKVQGVIIGRFKTDESFVDIWNSVKYHFPDNIPVVLNFPYGHFPEACALPLGIPATLKTHPFRLTW